MCEFPRRQRRSFGGQGTFPGVQVASPAPATPVGAWLPVVLYVVARLVFQGRAVCVPLPQFPFAPGAACWDLLPAVSCLDSRSRHLLGTCPPGGCCLMASSVARGFAFPQWMALKLMLLIGLVAARRPGEMRAPTPFPVVWPALS